MESKLNEWRHRGKREKKAHKASLLRVNAEQLRLSNEKTVCEALAKQKKETISAFQERLARVVAFDADSAGIAQASTASPADAPHSGGALGVLVAVEAVNAKRLEECKADLEKVRRDAATRLRKVENLRGLLTIVRQEANELCFKLELETTLIEVVRET